SRLIPCATSSLMFSITCGVNLTRLPLAEGLAFGMVMAAPSRVAQSSFGIDVRFTGPPPALITLGGDRVARRPYRFRKNLEETSQAQLTNIPSRRSKRLQAQTPPQSSLGAIHAGIGVRGESLRGCPWRWL